MCLPKVKFIELCEEFPASAKILKYKAYLRRKQFRKAKLEVQLANERKINPLKTSKLDMGSPRASVGQNNPNEPSVNETESQEETRKASIEENNGNGNPNIQVDGEQFLEHAKKLKVKGL